MVSLFLSVYADNSLNVEPARVIRQAEPAAEAPPKAASRVPFKSIQKVYNLADPVSEDYPVIFNIILFVAVSLILAVIAICVAISTMDPGKDSLIYRVTSGQKSKKDN